MTKHETFIYLKGMQKAYDLEGESEKAEVVEAIIGVVEDIDVVNPM